MTATDALSKARSFLASEENFRIVRELQIRNLVVPLVADFAGIKDGYAECLEIFAYGEFFPENHADLVPFKLVEGPIDESANR